MSELRVWIDKVETEQAGSMWALTRLAGDLREIGLRAGMTVLAHTSLRAIGTIEGGGETLLGALQEVVGPQGTVMVPTFTPDRVDPTEWRDPPTEPDELERLRMLMPPFDAQTSPADRNCVGVFPEIVRRHPGACRSDHPVVSFAAVGKEAGFLAERAPFHYPLGSDGPLARLHQLDGLVLLIGSTNRANSSLHLAEVWASAPYIHRSALVNMAPDTRLLMRGSPECSDGFDRIEPLLRHSRLLREGYIGNARSQLMRQRGVVSMAIAMLQGDGSALLCRRPDCRWCNAARKFTQAAAE